MTDKSIKSKNKFPLIKEEYSPEEARELLMTLVADTIHFHSLHNLRSWERSGDEDKSTDKKIEELNKLRENILEMLNSLDTENLSVEINAEIKVTAIKK